jgi:hypothetical protein
VLLLFLVLPAALLVMLIALERYERLIDRPMSARDGSPEPTGVTADGAATSLGADVAAELAPEAA